MYWIFEKLGCPRRRKANMDDVAPYEEMPSPPPLPILPATPPSTPLNETTTPSSESPTDTSDTSSITEPLEELIVTISAKEEPTALQQQINYVTGLIKSYFNDKYRKIRIPYTNDDINLYITKDDVVSLSIVSFNALVTTCLSLMHMELNNSNWTSHVTKKIVKITNNNYNNTFKSKFAKNSVTIAMPKSFEDYQKVVTS